MSSVTVVSIARSSPGFPSNDFPLAPSTKSQPSSCASHCGVAPASVRVHSTYVPAMVGNPEIATNASTATIAIVIANTELRMTSAGAGRVRGGACSIVAAVR